jgi:hypothetical protein
MDVPQERLDLSDTKSSARQLIDASPEGKVDLVATAGDRPGCDTIADGRQREEELMTDGERGRCAIVANPVKVSDGFRSAVTEALREQGWD